MCTPPRFSPEDYPDEYDYYNAPANWEEGWYYDDGYDDPYLAGEEWYDETGYEDDYDWGPFDDEEWYDEDDY